METKFEWLDHVGASFLLEGDRTLGMVIFAETYHTCFLWNGSTWNELTIDYETLEMGKEAIEKLVGTMRGHTT